MSRVAADGNRLRVRPQGDVRPRGEDDGAARVGCKRVDGESARSSGNRRNRELAVMTELFDIPKLMPLLLLRTIVEPAAPVCVPAAIWLKGSEEYEADAVTRVEPDIPKLTLLLFENTIVEPAAPVCVPAAT